MVSKAKVIDVNRQRIVDAAWAISSASVVRTNGRSGWDQQENALRLFGKFDLPRPCWPIIINRRRNVTLKEVTRAHPNAIRRPARKPRLPAHATRIGCEIKLPFVSAICARKPD